MEWISVIGGAISIILVLLRQWLKEKTRAQKAQDAGHQIHRKVVKMRYHLSNGRADLVEQQMEDLNRDIRVLLRLREKDHD
jgi:phage protein D